MRIYEIYDKTNKNYFKKVKIYETIKYIKVILISALTNGTKCDRKNSKEEIEKVFKLIPHD